MITRETSSLRAARISCTETRTPLFSSATRDNMNKMHQNINRTYLTHRERACKLIWSRSPMP